jgi:hypothetical protein
MDACLPYNYIFEQTITRQTCPTGQQYQAIVHIYKLSLGVRAGMRVCIPE